MCFRSGICARTWCVAFYLVHAFFELGVLIYCVYLELGVRFLLCLLITFNRLENFMDWVSFLKFEIVHVLEERFYLVHPFLNSVFVSAVFN